MICLSLGIYTHKAEAVESSSCVFLCPLHTLDTVVVGNHLFVTALSSH